MSVPMKPTDPAYWMLTDPSIERKKPLFDEPGCYICQDPEFAQMGLPLCYPCSKCKGHVAADDTVCWDCGHDQEKDRYEDIQPDQEHPTTRQDQVL